LFKAFTPNAFSPNGNNANEAFRPYINELVQVKSYELQVYDRWGGRVFRSVDLKMGWDGSIRGQIAAQGVYRYWFRIEYIDDRGPGNQLVQGEVSLFR
jgi:gliding motility-associated-like protein